MTFKWNEEYQTKLEELIRAAYSAKDAAKIMSAHYGHLITRNSVIGRANRTNIQFKYKPPGRPKGFLRARMPRLRTTFRVVPAPRTEYKAPSGTGIHPTVHTQWHCQCILDNGMRCDGERVPKSAWCEHHKQIFIRPKEHR